MFFKDLRLVPEDLKSITLNIQVHLKKHYIVKTKKKIVTFFKKLNFHIF